MKALRAKSAKAQRGSIYTTIILVALFGIVVLAVLKIAPAYVDDNTVNNTMRNIAETKEFATMSISEVRSSFMKTMNVNRIDFDAANIVLVREGGNEYVDIKYESRKPLFYNLDAVAKFSHRYEKN